MEAVTSLHVLLYPKRHPLQHPWIRGARSLSAALKREIRAFAFLYDDAAPDCFLPPAADSAPSFEEALAAFRALSGDRAAYELARPLFFYAAPNAARRRSRSRRCANASCSRARATARRARACRERLATLSAELLGYVDNAPQS